jgi:hypothetical protein
MPPAEFKRCCPHRLTVQRLLALTRLDLRFCVHLTAAAAVVGAHGSFARLAEPV